MKELGGIADRYTPDAGSVDGPVHCGVCNEEMTCVARNSRGPRNFIQAMEMIAKGEDDTATPHDIFVCPHKDESWHIQVVALRKAAYESVSGYLTKSLLEEAEDVLSSRKATKELSRLYRLGI